MSRVQHGLGYQLVFTGIAGIASSFGPSKRAAIGSFGETRVAISSRAVLRWAIPLLMLSAIGICLFVMKWQAHLPNRLIACSFMARHVTHSRLLDNTKASDRNEILSSWRLNTHFQITGNRKAVAVQYTQSWNSSENRAFANRLEQTEFGTGLSNIPMYAIRGEGSAFDSAIDKFPYEVLHKDAVLLVEICNSGCHWMEPGDVYIDKVQRPGIKAIQWPNSTPCYGGFCIGFADGAAWSLKSDTPTELILQMANHEFARSHNRDVVFGPYVIGKRSPR